MSGSTRPAGLVAWVLAGLAAAILAVWSFPRALPLLAGGWRVHGDEAAAVALDAFRELGEPVEEAYVVVFPDYAPSLEHRLRRAGAALSESRLGERSRMSFVAVYSPDAEPEDWTYLGRVSAGGAVWHIESRQEPGSEAAEVDPATARARADELLRRLGHDPASFEEPEPRRLEQREHTEVVLRYRDREEALGPDVPYGVEVEFAGDRLQSFRPWPRRFEDEDLLAGLRLVGWAAQVRLLTPYLLFALVAVPFVRRYNEGKVEVARAGRIFLLLLACGVMVMALLARGASGMMDIDVSRRLTTWVWGFRILTLAIAPMAMTAALCWAAGESRCRERWAEKLAAFDAVLRGRFATATVARAALRGPAAGLVVTAAILVLVVLLRGLGVEPVTSFLRLSESSLWPGPAILFLSFLFAAFSTLSAQLFLLPAAVARLGPWIGSVAVAVFSGVVFLPPLFTLPAGAELALAVPAAAAGVGLFLAYDLLTALLAGLTTSVVLGSLPYLFAEDTFLVLQGVFLLAALALPLFLSLRGLARGDEAVYRWQEMPPHVRRIAGRERQRLELETARRIQNLILPELPARLNGVELAHAYRPATEVGGDFYDVTELAGGRLALAVGDVAGHGVASGLVMAMARSALATQVTIDPAIEEVFHTLNRVLHDTARKSFMTTLCYAVLDPRRYELTFASAGHLFPYVVEAGGTVRWLESVAYPLGVRRELRIEPSKARLAGGDVLVLVSDGLVEAHREGCDEPFGFERLEECLRRSAGTSPPQLLRGVLADLARFTGPGPRQDDVTILVARLADPKRSPDTGSGRTT